MFLSSTLCWSDEVDEVIRLANQLGFSGVEVWAEHIWQRGTDESLIVKASLHDKQKLTLHAASWDLNLCALNKHVRQQSINEIERSMSLASRIGASNVTVHPGRQTLPELSDLHSKWLIDSFCYLAERAEQLGVTLSIELMEHIPKEFITTPEIINGLLNELSPRVMTTFDIAHVPLDEDVLTYFKRINRVSKIHFSDSIAGRCHVPLGKGNLPLRSILSVLKNVDVPVVLEGFDVSSSHEILHADLDFLTQIKK
ncbi:sugar phosphate isomerase/epimerase [Sporolactobacillus shoreicorticis]|uniref:Sugar phosphate isomerase/epimerase family protein n=1 Tax=Sporolactobacillus shoreicorticis TaxID=1923877 RepID=A0ABW5S4J5_9BACL|nr:sugar phosphate isomerase/epimerase family protein [Sporolactobacillus shoreicorticis]MCO7124416.1 sugar phosphate isomerase/epimerase [Sporolactobacillus shoreicorticis]